MPESSSTQHVRTPVALLAGGLWFAYGLVAFLWCLGAPGWPYGKSADAAHAGALLVGLDPETAGPFVVAASLAAAAVNLALAIGPNRGRRAVVTLAWVVAVVPLLTVPDARLLLAVFRILTGHADGLGWPVLHQVVCAVCALSTAVAIRTHSRRTSVRRPVTRSATGRWAAGLAIAAPLGYAAIRWSWALGIRVGATPEFIAPYTATGARVTEGILGAMCVCGALLTLGLVRPWGETVPGWVPLLGRRSVPPWLAVVPATAAAVVLTTAGLALSHGLVAMAAGLVPATPSAALPNWGAWLAAPLWALWGVSLGVATLAYHRRSTRRVRG